MGFYDEISAQQVSPILHFTYKGLRVPDITFWFRLDTATLSTYGFSVAGNTGTLISSSTFITPSGGKFQDDNITNQEAIPGLIDSGYVFISNANGTLCNTGATGQGRVGCWFSLSSADVHSTSKELITLTNDDGGTIVLSFDSGVLKVVQDESSTLISVSPSSWATPDWRFLELAWNMNDPILKLLCNGATLASSGSVSAQEPTPGSAIYIFEVPY